MQLLVIYGPRLTGCLWSQVVRMIALSARMVADATFARQLRRKFVHFERGQMLQKGEAE